MNSPKPIYINLCSSTKVQEPASEEAPIPVVICRLVQQPGPDKLMADTYDVVYHPKMIERLRKVGSARPRPRVCCVAAWPAACSRGLLRVGKTRCP